MNKKILSLLFLLILFLSVTLSYAYFSQQQTNSENQTPFGNTPDDTTIASEIDGTFLDENESIEIGDMI
jgi:hypothetical protein